MDESIYYSRWELIWLEYGKIFVYDAKIPEFWTVQCHLESIRSNILFIRLFHVLKFHIFLHNAIKLNDVIHFLIQIKLKPALNIHFPVADRFENTFHLGRESEYSSSVLDGYGAYGLCTEAVDLFVYFDAFDRRILCIWRALYQWPISVQASNIARRVRCMFNRIWEPTHFINLNVTIWSENKIIFQVFTFQYWHYLYTIWRISMFYLRAEKMFE